MKVFRLHQKARELPRIRALASASAAALSCAFVLQAASAFAAAESAAESVSAVSGATFNLSEIRSLRFSEDEDTGNISAADTSGEAKPGDFVFAIEETGHNEAYVQALKRLGEGLRMAFPDRSVHIRRIPSRVFLEVVKNEKIPFVFAAAGTMVSLVNELGAVPLAVRESVSGDGIPSSSAGGLLIVDARRSDLLTLKGLKGTRIAVESSSTFGPWQWLSGRLLKEGLDPKSFFSSTIWRPHDVPEVFNAIRTGRADVGLIGICTLETLLSDGMIDPKAFRTVGVMPENSNLCKSSTPRYPDWTLGYLSTADNGLVRRVAAVAFSVPEHQGSRWGIRVDLSEVRSLMQALHFGPYSYLDEQTFTGFMKRYAQVFAGIAALMLFIIFHALRSRYLVRVRTAELEKALAEKERMEAEVRVSRERLSAIERVGLLSQMSSMFAHELKQPLSSLSNYVGGLKLWNAHRKTSDSDRALADDALSAMAEETNRITSIVNRVRGYAKSSAEPMKLVNWTAVVRRAQLIVERHDARRVPIFTAPGKYLAAAEENDRPAWVMGDALELELLVLNFIRNAAHAAQANPKGFVSVSLGFEKGNYILHVTDNGPKLTPEGFARLTGYGDSVKQEGLGIGLSICRGIVDRHGGQLKFYQLPTEGICAEAVIEAAEPPESRDHDEADEQTEKKGETK